MSYKFPIYRCDMCGVVRFDPPSGDAPNMRPERHDDTGENWHEKVYPCRMVYADDRTVPGGIFALPVSPVMTPCGGTVEPFAYMDSDSFMYMLDSTPPRPKK